MESRPCPYCNSQIGEYAIKCPNCNSKLKTICKKCKKIVYTNWADCPNCGGKIYYETIYSSLKDNEPQERKTQIYSEFTPNLDSIEYEGQKIHSDFYPEERKTQIYSNCPLPTSIHGFKIRNENNAYILSDNYDYEKKTNSKILFISLLCILFIFTIALIIIGTTLKLGQYYNEGVILYNQGEYDEAISCFERALEIDPTHQDAKKYSSYAWFNKGVFLYQKKYYYEAIACFDKAIEINPNYLIALNNKGWALNGLERYSEAIACFDKAININPNYKEAWYRKGIVFYNEYEYYKALTCFDKAIKIDPRYADALYYKGVVFFKIDDYDSSIKFLESALVMDPNNDWAKKYLSYAWWNKGVELKNVGRYYEAQKCFDNARQLNPYFK